MRRAPDRYRGRASSLWPLADPAEARSGRYRCLAEVRTDRGEQALFDPIGSILGERQVRGVGLADWECRRSHAYVDHYKEEAGQAGRPGSADGDSGPRSIREALAQGKLRCLSALRFRRLCACPSSRSSVELLVRVSFVTLDKAIENTAFTEAYCRRPGPTADGAVPGLRD
jgi:hypothetical protein